MIQPPRTKCEMCARIYEDDPLTQKDWWSGNDETTDDEGLYSVLAFHPDAREHLCSTVCLQRRISAVVKPERA